MKKKIGIAMMSVSVSIMYVVWATAVYLTDGFAALCGLLVATVLGLMLLVGFFLYW